MKLWSQKYKCFVGKKVISMIMYYDDFETCNPLGTKSGAHKLGAVYIGFPTLPPECNSSLRNILLVMLFRCSRTAEKRQQTEQ